MTVLDQNRTQAAPEAGQGQKPQRNVGHSERAVSLAGGSILALLGLARGSLAGLVTAGIGGALIYRGASGHSYAYDALGQNTAEGDISTRGIHVEQAMLINKSPEELYRYWRNFTNLPRIMSYLDRVDVLDDRRSHWVARAPRIAGGQAEWDAEITRDEPNSVIAWQSLPGSQIDCAGEVRFSPAMGDRGTEIHVSMQYLPPAGRLGHWIATLFGESPHRTVREDLRNFKRLMETGEVLTTEGQPHGSCMGLGKLRSE